MTVLDWLIVAFALLLALRGFRQGFIVGLLSFVGFAIGAVVGTRIGRSLLSGGDTSPYAPAFGLVGALVAGAVLAAGFEGVGLRMRRALRLPGLWVVDGAFGAVLSGAVGLGVVWIVAAVAVQLPGQTSLRLTVQRSIIVRELNSLLPPSGPILNALSRLDPLPTIAGPSPDVAPPRAAIARAPAVEAASPSVVRVVGDACGLGIEGSGWVIRPGVVVTNAHVVAGEHDTTVEVRGDSNATLAAQPIAFDVHDDIAILRVPGLMERPLPLADDPSAGTEGAILGYPEDGPFDVRAARIGATQTVVTQDAYGNGPVQRLITPLRGLVRPGNSGGPVVDDRGEVLTTVFASTTGGGPEGGYGVANAVVASTLAKASGPVSTGPCGG